MKKFEEKTIQTESIYKGKVISLQVDDVELPNGKTSKRELVKQTRAWRGTKTNSYERIGRRDRL